jgi:hypothetical protein
MRDSCGRTTFLCQNIATLQLTPNHANYISVTESRVHANRENNGDNSQGRQALLSFPVVKGC